MIRTSPLRRAGAAEPDQCAERVGESHPAWWPEHRSRYRFAAPHVAGMTVLDIACGTGYGSHMLLEAGAAGVISADYSADGLGQALAGRVPGQHLCRADGTAIPLRDGCVDVITSFETIEHLVDMEAFLTELRRVLKPSGTMFLSTPNAWFTKPVDGKPANPFHIRELTPPELEEMLRSRFSRVEMLGQHTSAAYGVCAYWELPERLPRAPRVRAGVLVWKALARLPYPAGDRLSRLFCGRGFYPGEGDFEFTPDALATGHVQLAVCRP